MIALYKAHWQDEDGLCIIGRLADDTEVHILIPKKYIPELVGSQASLEGAEQAINTIVYYEASGNINASQTMLKTAATLAHQEQIEDNTYILTKMTDVQKLLTKQGVVFELGQISKMLDRFKRLGTFREIQPGVIAWCTDFRVFL